MKTSTKMYLSIFLSTACILFYQYQLSKANLLSSGNVDHIDNEVSHSLRHSTIPSTTTTTTTSLPLTSTTEKTSDGKCEVKSEDCLKLDYSMMDLLRMILPPPLYIITPTYKRPEQVAEITRLGYTLKHIPNIFWLVIEDATLATPQVTRQLKRIGIPFEHYTAPMPNKYKKNKVKPRGVSNRNRGLDWIRANATDGVFYFADDDNTYDLQIFHEMRYTKKVSMWPVGLVTKYGLSSPIIRKGKLDGFYDGWIGGRKYPVDMAGFAVNVKFFLSRPKAAMPYKPGYEEDGFLKSLAPLNNTEIELLASECTEVLTWHTQTKKNQPASNLDLKKYNGTNLIKLRDIIV